MAALRRQWVEDPGQTQVVSCCALFSPPECANLGISLLLTIQLQTNFVFSIVNITIENATILIADGVLIYRCWIVFDKPWRVILLPTMLWLADLAFALMFAVYQVSLYLSLRQIIDYPLSMEMWTLFYAFNIAINIYTTLAIIYRIWRVARNSASTDLGHLYNVSRILAESGILLTITSAMNLGATANYMGPMPYVIRPTMDALHFSMTGITFNLILIRTGSEGARLGSDYTPDSKSDVGLGGQESLSTLQFYVPTIGGADQEASSSPSYHEQKDQEEIQEVATGF
ncbi:hypothetical protein M378DRAFT_323465 [Amanita muscaria Koide BX008]|uniref:Uncharacterized protein n=1 Tax=Amanita muscaria (strain Koide BX008) TaxID=946122 RepID=A0A0C2SUF4_AMAMK|nr:hypothetical protein M378DRAFT_323465 [Amanita muscaria Koide BX008]